MQQQPQSPPPLGIAFDTGLAHAADVLALAMLYGLNGHNDARLLSVTVSGSNLQAAAFCEAVGRFYAGPVSGAFGGAARTLPVGLATDGKLSGDLPLFIAPLKEHSYPHNIEKMNDTADPVAVVRNALTTQPDGNAVIVASGPLNTLAHVIALKASHETVVSKCKTLVLAIGDFAPDAEPELYARTDAAAARHVLADWPTPIVVCGAEIGRALPFPASSIAADFAWSQAHPVVDAWKAENAPNAPGTPLAAVLFAAKPAENFFKLSEPGRVEIAADGRTKFSPVAGGNHRHLIFDPAQKDRILEEYVKLASAKPAPPPVRRRP